MTNYPNSSQSNNSLNHEKDSFSEASLETIKPINLISSLFNSHISPKFLSPIAAKSLNSIGSFPFAHSALGNGESLGDGTEPLNILEDFSSSEGGLSSSVENIQREIENIPPVTNLQREVETTPSVNIGETNVINLQREVVENPQLPDILGDISTISSLNNIQSLGSAGNANINISSLTNNPIQRRINTDSPNLDPFSLNLDHTSTETPVNPSLNNQDIPELPTTIESISNLQSLNTIQSLRDNPTSNSSNPSEARVSSLNLIQRQTSSPSSNTSNPLFGESQDTEDSIQSIESVRGQGVSTEIPSIQRNSNVNQSGGNSWSNISQLLGENSSSSNSYSQSQTTVENIIQRAYSPNIEVPENKYISSTSANIIQKLDAKILGKTGNELSNVSEEDESSSDEYDAQNFEILAREIYGLLRNRLMIERERKGTYASDRLPW